MEKDGSNGEVSAAGGSPPGMSPAPPPPTAEPRTGAAGRRAAAPPRLCAAVLLRRHSYIPLQPKGANRCDRMTSCLVGYRITGYSVNPITRCTPGPLPFWSSLPGGHLKF